MTHSTNNPWLHRFAVLTAIATLGLVGMGGLVTSHGVGMAVPDWPTSYGYNMFALPISTWFTGGIFHEHTHRLWASWVGILVVTLTRWLGGKQSRRPLLIIGALEILAGILLLLLGDAWKGAGHFLSGIGGVVLLAGIVWWKNDSTSRPLPALGWWVFGLVQLQGLLGGLRVVLDAQDVAGLRLGTVFGIFHACLAQAFLVLLFVIALMTSRSWTASTVWREDAMASATPMHGLLLTTSVLIFFQLMIAATMRHQHAGLAIPDFPLAYGKLWPAMDAASLEVYNVRRLETVAVNPITAFQITLQMVHRGMAFLILVGVLVCAWCSHRSIAEMRRVMTIWVGLILVQVGLGAWTIWSNKAADIATAHVMVGALSLVTGVLGCIISYRRFSGNKGSAVASFSETAVVHPVSV